MSETSCFAATAIAMDDRSKPQSLESEQAQAPAGPQHLVYLAEDLFRGQKEVVIRYGESDYRLRITKTGKLLLTK